MPNDPPTRRVAARAIVLTGGPGAGKTVIAAAVASRLRGRVVAVPEAATQVYRLLQTRWDRLDLDGRRDVQRRIYRLQVDQEARLRAADPAVALLLDRGTIDGATYWPEGPQDYWREVGTTFDAELRRYDAVIWLESAAALGLYDGDASNAVRFERPAEAIAAGQRLLDLWGRHPRLRRVDASPDLERKIAAVEQIVRQELDG